MLHIMKAVAVQQVLASVLWCGVGHVGKPLCKVLPFEMPEGAMPDTLLSSPSLYGLYLLMSK